MENMPKPFDLDLLVNQLRQCVGKDSPSAGVKAVLQSAVREPQWISESMPDFEENDVILFEDESISIWHCRFMPDHSVPPHDHQMVATIGVYSGAERNDFYENDPDGGLRKSSEVVLSEGQVLQIGPSAIHAVGCASPEPCCGIHVYLGRLSQVDRSLFDAQTGACLQFTDENYQKMITPDQP